MKINRFDIPGLIEIFPQRYSDSRGFFQETFNKKVFQKFGLENSFVQDNESQSSAGVFRGLHLQKTPYAQGKLVRISSGKALDIALDLRTSSPTFKKVQHVILDASKGNMFYIPEGFAHGFLALESCIFSYKCTSQYCKEAETGVHWADPSLNLLSLFKKFGFSKKDIIISKKDDELPFLDQFLVSNLL